MKEESTDLNNTLWSCFKKVSKTAIVLAILWGICVLIYNSTETISTIFWNINNNVLLPIKHTIQNFIYYIIAFFVFMFAWLSCVASNLAPKDYKSNIIVSKYQAIISVLMLISFSLLYDKIDNEAGEIFVGILIFINVIVSFFCTISFIESKPLPSKEKPKTNQEQKVPEQLKLFD